MSEVDYSKGFARTCLLLIVAVVFGWILTSSNGSDLAANAPMLLIIPLIGLGYYLLKDRVEHLRPEEA